MDVRRLRNPLTIAGLVTVVSILASDYSPLGTAPAVASPVSLMTPAEFLELLLAVPLPAEAKADLLVVEKAQRQLLAYSHGVLPDTIRAVRSWFTGFTTALVGSAARTASLIGPPAAWP